MRSIRFLVSAFLLAAGTLLWATSDPVASKQDNTDLEQFAKRIEASIQNDNPSYFTECFDVDALLLKVMNKTDTTDLEDFEKGFRYGFASGFDPGANILSEVGEKGTFTFLHLIKHGQQNSLLFRIVNNEEINYHEYMVVPSEEGYKITDIFVYNSGSWLSQILKDFYQGFSNVTAPGNESNNKFVAGIKNAKKIRKLMSKGKYNRAYKMYREIPEQVRSHNIFQIMGMRLSSHLSKEVCLSEYREFVDNMPSTGATYLIALESFVMNQNQNMALKCIDSVDHYIEGDPFLNMFRANLYFQMKDYDQAEIRLKTLIDAMPEYQEGYFSLLGLYLKTKNYECATGILDQMTENFNYYKEDVKTLLKEYPDFVASKEYKNWISK